MLNYDSLTLHRATCIPMLSGTAQCPASVPLPPLSGSTRQFATDAASRNDPKPLCSKPPAEPHLDTPLIFWTQRLKRRDEGWPYCVNVSLSGLGILHIVLGQQVPYLSHGMLKGHADIIYTTLDKDYYQHIVHCMEYGVARTGGSHWHT